MKYRTAYIIFRDSKYFFSFLFKKGFRHVSCFIEIDDKTSNKKENLYLMVDPYLEGVDIYLTDMEGVYSYFNILHDAEPNSSVIRVQIPYNLKFSFNTFGITLFSCVKVIKQLIKLSKGCISPYGLYKTLYKKRTIYHPFRMTTTLYENRAYEEPN